jgi:hypothetical protein
MTGDLARRDVMSSNLIGLVIAAIGAIAFVTVAVGLPALAVVFVRYFKLKERQLTLELEFRERVQDQDLALENRVQRLEDALTSLDHDVRVRPGIDGSPLEAPPDLMDAPGVSDAGRGKPLEPASTRVR